MQACLYVLEDGLGWRARSAFLGTFSAGAGSGPIEMENVVL